MKKLLLLLLMLSPTAFGSLFPVITSLTSKLNYDGATYTFTQRLIDIGAAGDQVIPSGWYMSIGHKHHESNEFHVNFGAYDVTPNKYGLADGKKTASELGLYVYNELFYKRAARIEHTGSNDFQECVGYFAGPYQGNFSPWDSAIKPSGCMMVPPASEWCKITTPEILLDHGTITLKDAEGSSSASSVGVQCTTPTAVTFNLITNDTYVYLDEGKSEISVDNKPLNTKIDLEQGDSQLAIKDKLTGINSEGAHTGSSVLVMMPY